MRTCFNQESLAEASKEQAPSQVNVPSNLLKLYAKDVDFEKAKLQLQILPDLVKTFKQSEGLNKLKVTSIITVADILNHVPLAKNMFSEVGNLVHLYFTIPITTCTAERSFSSLQGIKTYLRSTMTKECHNNVLLLHPYKEHTTTLDLKEIASMFISIKRRRAFFGYI